MGPTKPEPGFAAEIEAKPSPRIIKPHLPFYLLHPTLVDTSKVNLMKLHRCEASIDEFAQYFMEDEGNLIEIKCLVER